MRGLYNRITGLDNCITKFENELQNSKLNKRIHNGIMGRKVNNKIRKGMIGFEHAYKNS